MFHFRVSAPKGCKDKAQGRALGLKVDLQASPERARASFCGKKFVRRAKRVRGYSDSFRSRRALPITERELKLMAAAAIAGLNSHPKKG